MPDANLERRVAILEQNMNQLADLPARVTALESQVLQLRGEMRSEFSALRTEMQAGFTAVRGEMQTESFSVAGDMRSGFSAVRTEMRVLHGEVISVIALLQEAPEGDRPRRVKPRSRRKKP
jgi:hypothetical protein